MATENKIDTPEGAHPGLVEGGAAGEAGASAEGTISPEEALDQLTIGSGKADPGVEGKVDNPQGPGFVSRPDLRGA